MPTLKTKISKFDGTVTELETNLGLHDSIQAYLQLERDGNWYAYCSGVATAAIFIYADLSVTPSEVCRPVRPNSNSRLLQSQSLYLDFDCERSRSRTESGQRQTDCFAANVFLGGDRFRTRGISYRNDQVAGNGPRGSKTARHAAVFDPGGPLSGGSVIGVTYPARARIKIWCEGKCTRFGE